MSPQEKEKSENIYPHYAQTDLMIERSQGSRLFDTSGKEYIDSFDGIAVSS